MIHQECSIQNSAVSRDGSTNCRQTTFGNLWQIDVLADSGTGRPTCLFRIHRSVPPAVYINDTGTVYNNDTRWRGGLPRML